MRMVGGRGEVVLLSPFNMVNSKLNVVFPGISNWCLVRGMDHDCISLPRTCNFCQKGPCQGSRDLS